MQKTLESDHYQVVIVGSSDKIPKPKRLEGENLRSLVVLSNTEEPKTKIYLNSEYYNTKKALANGISSAVFENTINDAISYDKTEDESAERAFYAGEELIDLLSQL